LLTHNAGCGGGFFGETSFKGLTQNRPLSELTHGDIYNAFKNTPFTPSNHAIMRLREIRTLKGGVETLNDFSRLLNKGVVNQLGDGIVSISNGRLEAIVNSATNVIITVTP
jgi:hypothetical protein